MAMALLGSGMSIYPRLSPAERRDVISRSRLELFKLLTPDAPVEDFEQLRARLKHGRTSRQRVWSCSGANPNVQNWYRNKQQQCPEVQPPIPHNSLIRLVAAVGLEPTT